MNYILQRKILCVGYFLGFEIKDMLHYSLLKEPNNHSSLLFCIISRHIIFYLFIMDSTSKA